MKNLTLRILFASFFFLAAAIQLRAGDLIINNPSQKSDTLTKEFKNNIYPGISLGLMWGSLNVNYERKIFGFGTEHWTPVWMRLTYGKWGVWGASGIGGQATINLIPSEKPFHPEAGLGVTVLYIQESENHDRDPNEPPADYNHFWARPAVNLGFRYQHPAKHFLFRMGAAFPEGAYLGMGVHF